MRGFCCNSCSFVVKRFSRGGETVALRPESLPKAFEVGHQSVLGQIDLSAQSLLAAASGGRNRISQVDPEGACSVYPKFTRRGEWRATCPLRLSIHDEGTTFVSKTQRTAPRLERFGSGTYLDDSVAG
jgi:hypothetical protein